MWASAAWPNRPREVAQVDGLARLGFVDATADALRGLWVTPYGHLAFRDGYDGGEDQDAGDVGFDPVALDWSRQDLSCGFSARRAALITLWASAPYAADSCKVFQTRK